MKSVKKIEGLLYSRYGSSIVSVTSLDGSERYEQTTPNEYSEKCNLPFADVTKYYYVKDGHLYLPNSKIQAVNLVLITTKEESLEGVSSCQDSCDCKSVWDYEFKAPDRLLEVVRTETAQKISQTIQIPTDENPNLDSNQRTAR
jgi:hypothetical protein